MAQWAFTYYQFVACILLTVTPLLRNKPAARKHRRAVVPARRWGRIATGYVTNLREAENGDHEGSDLHAVILLVRLCPASSGC